MAESLSVDEKATIARRFIAHAPPGEFNEVFNDVRTLVDDESLVEESISQAFADYNREQCIPTKIQNSEEECLITEANDLSDGRFYDPRTKQSFKFDHLRRQASEYEDYQTDEEAEPWRLALEKELTGYIKERFIYGACTVVGTSNIDTITLSAFIESHKFEPKNFWNGRWRSKWSVTFNKDQTECELTGAVHSQVHYFEDGNVQLVSDKDLKETVQIQGETATAKEIVRIIRQEEDNYQQAVNENYQIMSDSTFKELRRQLPITKTKMDWTKLAAYKIVTDLKNA
jgi:capping protein alpha